MNPSKKNIKYFISYAHDDESKLLDQFVSLLKNNFDCSRNFTYEGWIDRDILPGEKWRQEIDDALNECDFGLLLISLPFLNSQFISEVELPRFLLNLPKEAESNIQAIPVGFKHIDIKNHDLKGLEEQQIFFLNKLPFDRCRGTKKEDFVYQLFLKIEDVLKKK